MTRHSRAVSLWHSIQRALQLGRFLFLTPRHSPFLCPLSLIHAERVSSMFRRRDKGRSKSKGKSMFRSNVSKYSDSDQSESTRSPTPPLPISGENPHPQPVITPAHKVFNMTNAPHRQPAFLNMPRSVVSGVGTDGAESSYNLSRRGERL